jgi:hypothetical protein
MSDVYEILEDMVDRSGKNRREVAEDLGREYSTLRRELNPFDQGAKIGVELLIPLMRSTGRTDILQYLAERMGYRLERIDCQPDKPTVPEELLDTYQSIAAYHQAIQSKAALTEVGRLLEMATSELEQDFIAFRKEQGVRQ